MKYFKFYLFILFTGHIGLSQQRWSIDPTITSTGVMDIGKYIDFHESSDDENDYSIRLYSDNNILKSSSSLSVRGENIGIKDLSFMQNSRTMLIGWNRSSGAGETSFITNRGTGSTGGFEFRDINNSGLEKLLIKIRGDGYIGIGTNTPSNRVTITGDELNKPSLLLRNTSYNSTNSTGSTSLQFAFSNHIGPKIEASKTAYNTTALNFYTEYGFNNLQHGLTIKPTVNGSFVGIGTINPDSKLSVKGKIHAEEVKVDLSVPGPDYVFKENYKLRSLEEIQTFINQNGHLPNIPSAKEMETNGIELGLMNMKLLEKIEELTLYIIELKNEVNNLKKVKHE